MIVYHGSNMIVEHPDIKHSFRALDFGKGFYVMEDFNEFAYKCFETDLTEWIDLLLYESFYEVITK